MLDEDIRSALKCRLRNEDGSASIIDELPLLRGRGRADLAFVNGDLCGYEIKSDVDSLVRLGVQADHYQSVFEFVTLVAATKHIRHARERIPKSWGIIEAKEVDGKISLIPRRKPRRNRQVDNAALVRVLWKRECVRILSKRQMRISADRPVREIWTLLESLPSPALCNEVRLALKLRFGPAGTSQTQCDDSRTIEATESVLPGLLNYQ